MMAALSSSLRPSKLLVGLGVKEVVGAASVCRIGSRPSKRGFWNRKSGRSLLGTGRLPGRWRGGRSASSLRGGETSK